MWKQTFFREHIIWLVFVTLNQILQSQFFEKGFKKAENSEKNVVLLLFLFTLDNLVGCEHHLTLYIYIYFDQHLLVYYS